MDKNDFQEDRQPVAGDQSPFKIGATAKLFQQNNHLMKTIGWLNERNNPLLKNIGLLNERNNPFLKSSGWLNERNPLLKNFGLLTTNAIYGAICDT